MHSAQNPLIAPDRIKRKPTMNTEASYRKKRRIPSKNRSMLFRFLTTVIVAMLAVAIFIGGLSIYAVDKYIQKQAREFINITCANEGAMINNSLGNMEKSVKIMESYLMDFFENEENIEDPAFQERVIKNAEQMFLDVIKHTSNSGAIAYYFRLDPSISDSTAGLFYSKLEGGTEFLSFEPTDLSLYEKDDVEHVGWFWQPYAAKKPIWMEPYHNQNNGILMISYVIPMYIGKTFIGIVGMDFDYKLLADQVKKIKIYENGFAHLEINGSVLLGDENALDSAADTDSSKYLRVSKELVNGMTLVLSASYDDIRQARHDITFNILFAILGLFALFTAIAVFIVRRIVDPLKKLTAASVKLSGGDYNVEIVHSNTTEINLLSAAFENMARHLYEREEFLRRSADFDSLTGLRNTTSYTSFAAEFDKKIEADQVDFGVVVLDLNNLKKANDGHGHGVGDELIIAAARIISDIFRGSPIFRIGGDEFLVILRGDDLKNCEALFEQLKLTCAHTFVNGNTELPVHLAFGFAGFDSSRDRCLKDVFKRADTAMYENKRKDKMK